MFLLKILTGLCTTNIQKNNKHKDRKHFCIDCLQGFSSLDVSEDHQKVQLKINIKQSIKIFEKTMK